MQPLRNTYRHKPITPEFKDAWRRLRRRRSAHFAPQYVLDRMSMRWRISALYVCVHRGDPFAKRAFARVIAERMKL